MQTLEFRELDRPERKLFFDRLSDSHMIRTKVYVRDASETHAHDISQLITSGQVDLDVSNVPDRTLSITILDPDYRFDPTDPHNPALGGLWAGSIISCSYDVEVPSIPAWVSTPVFWGPVTNFERSGSEINVSAQGKESYLLPPNTYDNIFGQTELNRNSQTRESALRSLLHAVGEPQVLDWQGTNDHLPKDFSASKFFHRADRSYLALAQEIVTGENQFYYDGSGRPRCRTKPVSTVFDLDRYITTNAAPAFDVTVIRNRARASTRHKPRFIVIEKLKPENPLSAMSLGRSGVNRYLDAPNASRTFKSKSAASNAAQHALVSEDIVTATFDMLPVPFLDPLDQAKVQDPRGRVVTFIVRQYSFPLHTGDGMSMGYNRKLLDPRNTVARFIKKKQRHGQH